MGIGRKGISIMQDAIIFCIIVSIAALAVAPALLGGKMARVYEEKEGEEKVNEALYTFLNSNTNDFEYILFDLEVGGFIGGLMKKFFGKEPIHASYGELISAYLLCQIRCEGKNYNFFVNDFERNLKKEIEEFLGDYLKGYKFNFTAIWQPIVGFDFGGKISIGEEIPDKSVYSSRLSILMPPSFITSLGLEIEKIKNEIDRERIKNYLDKFVEEFIEDNLNEYFNYFREGLSDFIFNEKSEKFLDGIFNEFIGDEFSNLCEKMSESVKNSINSFIDENYDKIEEILEKIDFCRAEVELAIWR
ncbi:MAG: hypothetical protein H5T45_05850 [Thermoplasmatales archaeon]|nr:hypothetical protein [Thermoplasmatales archaeon]